MNKNIESEDNFLRQQSLSLPGQSYIHNQMQKTIISTGNAPGAIGPYSQACEVNGMLFISGQIPIDPKTGNIVEGGITEQTEQVLKNMGAILSAAGYTSKDVVKTTCLLADMSDFKAMNEMYARYFPSEPPARAAFAVKSLPVGALVEIEAIAVKSK